MNEMSEHEVWAGQLLMETGDEHKRRIIEFFSAAAGFQNETGDLDVDMENPWRHEDFPRDRFIDSGERNGMFFAWDKSYLEDHAYQHTLFVRRLSRVVT